MELALGHGALAEEARGDPALAPQLVGQRQPDGDGEAAADDGVAAVEAVRATSNRCIEPPRPRLQPSTLPNISAMTAPGRDALEQRVAVLAVGGDDVVVGLERGQHAGGDGLLADVEVEEAADLRLAGRARRSAPRTGGSAASAAAGRAPRSDGRVRSRSAHGSPASRGRLRAGRARGPAARGA